MYAVEVPVGGDSDEVPLVGDGVPVAEGGDEAELLRQTLVEDPPESSQGRLNHEQILKCWPCTGWKQRLWYDTG